MSHRQSPGIAHFVKQRNGNGDGRVYRVEPPVSVEGVEYDHVWVSAVNDGYCHETYIFPCDAAGKVADWGELDGSYRGGSDHAKALRRAGYEVA